MDGIGVDEIKAALVQWERKWDAIKSRRDTMIELAEDYEGYVQGVKEVLRASKRMNILTGICGVVAELIEVPEHLETALEIALGSSIQHVIVETEQSAMDSIAYLKSRQLGRAAFLPKDRIQGNLISESTQEKAAKIKGFIGIAVDLVTFNEEFRGVFTYLLGNLILAENLEAANRIGEKIQYQNRIVTLEGDFINPGGVIVGGSLGKRNLNLLGRKRALSEMKHQMDIIMEKITDLKTKLHSNH